ncbi:ATP-dependent Clp protease adapter ClpS [Acetivibrio mesophilus]|uniref:ATP-dependent Clp protease adapter protein ClpS n=1 Tax=Acetivibrio mesophilus TaxID=2487273 RepID=A0A4Q0I6H2_9FIRM|nr:ATP-dependent Clp protease adapter ClpS [Acetivibrio mesophilus]ODM25005.1 ATP-dependent Clp protease adaptor ClpS [Clostridium sp. Bc-iso-3]RXE59996.1 ATP-dependent Clp protease adapter ClpS [Acetivibrio mesophilus]HHV29417.1 ATP-dependent Clp protease adapter ClpS [Clostridium sp.]
MAEKTILKRETNLDFNKPKMYKVILLNDDYTTMDFVVEILITVFHKNAADATKIMLDVHQKGRGIVGVYTYDIARTKIALVEKMATEREFPLAAVMEPE